MTSNLGCRGVVKATVTVLVTQVVLGLPVFAKAKSAIAGASVLILAQPSFLGALSTLNINITQAELGPVDNHLAAIMPAARFQFAIPAIFSISGLPDQSFSIVMPQPGISTTAAGSFKFSNFKHNAGSTPTIGSNGSKVFSIGASVKFTPFSTGPSGDSAPAKGGNGKISGKKLAKKTPTGKKLIPHPNPFGIQGVQDGFLNVLIAYN